MRSLLFNAVPLLFALGLGSEDEAKGGEDEDEGRGEVVDLVEGLELAAAFLDFFFFFSCWEKGSIKI